MVTHNKCINLTNAMLSKSDFNSAYLKSFYVKLKASKTDSCC